MTTYINKERRDAILGNIRVAVQAKIDKSIVGKELIALKKKVVAETRKAVKKECSNKEMNTLKKYGYTGNMSTYSFYVNENKEIIDGYIHASTPHTILVFNPALCIPNTFKWVYRNVIAVDTDLSTLYIELYKLDDLLQCEVIKTVEAYDMRIGGTRTISALLKKHPKMRKYIPGATGSINTKEDKLIKAFEES